MAYISSSPRFLVSTLSSPLLPARCYADVATRQPLSGVDLDHIGGLRTRLQGWQSAPSEVADQVRTIWLPADSGYLSTFAGESIGLFHRSPDSFPTIIVDRPVRYPRDDMSQQIAAGIRLRQTIGDSLRIAISVRPHHINGTRAHLSALSALRMQASEWNLDLALDLSRELDWLWEAEAAIYRLMSSLQILRISSSAETLDGRFRSSLTERALVSCAELGFSGLISLVTPVPWWHWRNQRTIEASCRDAAGRVSRRMSKVLASSDFSTEISAQVEFE